MRGLLLLLIVAACGTPKGRDVVSDHYAPVTPVSYRYTDVNGKQDVLELIEKLSGTTTAKPANLAYAADRLFYVLSVDEDPEVRLAACEALKKIRGRLSEPEKASIEGAPAFERMLFLGSAVRKEPTRKQMVEALEEIAALEAPTMLAARAQVRIFLIPPIIDSRSFDVRGAITLQAPVATRRAIDVVLDQLANGRTRYDPLAKPDPSAEVRAAAASTAS